MSEPTRLAVDIGGTFTDLALEHAGGLATAKVLTTPGAPEEGVMTGVRSVAAAAGVALGDIRLVIHGTTLATNALIERKGARTAFVSTEGFRDVLAMRNESRYEQYDLNIVLPEPLVPRHLRLTVPERLDRKGRALLPLDEKAVRRLVPVLKRERVESVAIGFLHGFVDPTHERRAAAILAEELPDVPISLSSEVSPEMREWERFSTTAANAYVQPLMARYLRRLERDLRATGISAPILMMLSGGNVTTIDTACRFPIRLVESGPAGGAIFSASVARRCGLTRALSFDMGGTTAKICLIDDFQPQTSRTFEVARVGRFKKGSGLPLRIPVIEMVEIGAGGGSLADVDALGRIAVGPESAGADPGPACYGRGGVRPAVTDANLTLGRYDPERFAGGSLRLDAGAAEAALADSVGRRLGMDAGLAALGVVEMVDENMANAARVHAVESGKTCEERTLIAFGGGGPVHAARIAEKLGVTRVLAPSGAGVGSAIGFLRAAVGYEVVRSLYQRLGALDLGAINALLAAMAEEAAAVVAQGSFGAATQETRLAYMRYVGQGHEIAVSLPARPLHAGDATAIRSAYDAEYTRLYSRPAPSSDIEVMSFAVTVATSPPLPVAPPPAPSPYRAEPAGARTVRDTATGALEEWTIYDRARLSPGARLEGPAIVAEAETSTLIGAGWQGWVTADGHIEMARAGWPEPAPPVLPGLEPGIQAAPSVAFLRTPVLDARVEPVQDEGAGLGSARSATPPTTPAPSAELAAIRKQILWNRLTAVVEEQAQTMIRTAFSTTVREAGDLSAGVFDLEGRMLAQAVTGTPGHVNSMMESVGHFLTKFPAATMREGDHYITNDPWLGTGHLHDLTVVSPAFRNGRIVGLFANTAHVIDVGGLGMGPEGRSVFEEGLYIPIVKCFDAGRPNETFFDFIRAGTRLPIELEGDVYSLCACNDAGARQLVRLMDEFALESLDELASFIFDNSLRATLARIAELPRGVFSAEISSDGYEAPVTLKAAMTIRSDAIEVDFAGTSGLSTRGINVPAAYCRAYAAFGIKVVTAPEVPNNWASLAPFRFVIPEGSILNAPRPYPVSVRHVIGQLLPDLMMGCLSQAAPERVAAEGSSCLWNPPLRGGGAVSGQGSGNRCVLPDFEVITFNSGGTGARRERDGLDATAFPSGVRTMPVEATENFAPIVVWRKELRPDSGGPGRARGGLGQIMEISGDDDLEFACNATFDRIGHPPKGRDGGLAGAAGRVELKSGAALRAKGFQIVPDGDRLVLSLPGGGGMGDPATRDAAAVAADVRDGMVSAASAERDYGVVLGADGRVDDVATARLRGRG